MARVKFDRDSKGGRLVLVMGYCSSNIRNELELKLACSGKNSSCFENNFPMFLLSDNLNTKCEWFFTFSTFLSNKDRLQYFP